MSPRTTRSQNVSIKVDFLWTLHAEGSSLENDLMVGIVSGSRRGRQRKRWMDCILADAGISLAEAVALCESRYAWKQLRGVSGPPEAQLVHTLSKFYCLLHEFYLINHHSPQEHAIYGTSCLLLAFLNLTTCHLSNLRSISS